MMETIFDRADELDSIIASLLRSQKCHDINEFRWKVLVSCATIMAEEVEISRELAARLRAKGFREIPKNHPSRSVSDEMQLVTLVVRILGLSVIAWLILSVVN
jgi:hypothetical protein